MRDVGDYLEIPLVEEVLEKKTVVREVVRIRKDSELGRALVRGERRREDVVVDREPARPEEGPPRRGRAGDEDAPPRV